jgi:uncharacterized membrane protein YidH (DUF202 family)
MSAPADPRVLFSAERTLLAWQRSSRFVKTLPAEDVSSGYLISLGSIMNLVIAAVGILLAAYLLVTGLQAR